MQRARAFGDQKEMSTSEEDTASKRKMFDTRTDDSERASASERQADFVNMC
jgi:hypothetical protein